MNADSSLALSSSMLTIAEVAARLRISRATAYELMANGSLGFHQIGRRRLVSSSDLQQFLQACFAAELEKPS